LMCKKVMHFIWHQKHGLKSGSPCTSGYVTAKDTV
jgi:hypothetical protein